MAEEQSGGMSGSSDKGSIISARGTGDGLILRIDGRLQPEGITDALTDFVRSRRSFLSGNEVVFEWVGGEPDRSVVKGLSERLLEDFGITVKEPKPQLVEARTDAKAAGRRPNADVIAPPPLEDRRSTLEQQVDTSRRPKGAPGLGRSSSLFDGVEALVQESRGDQKSRVSAAVDSGLWDDANARIVVSTLRSGQKIETEHSLVVFGDVNSGAEVIAGGDIVILGTLRGVAHAGAYDETGAGRVIFAINLQPTQLRIGSVISRGAPEQRVGPEVARIENSMIVVEPYNAKIVAARGARL